MTRSIYSSGARHEPLTQVHLEAGRHHNHAADEEEGDEAPEATILTDNLERCRTLDHQEFATG
jgi:hypothetical protein